MEQINANDLKSVYRAIVTNPTLKYVTKLILSYKPHESSDEYVRHLKIGKSFCKYSREWSIDESNKFLNSVQRPDNIYNIFFIHCIDDGKTICTILTIQWLFHNFLEQLFEKLTGFGKQYSLQEILRKTYDPRLLDSLKLFGVYPAVPCYLHNFNPALAIIINHACFFHEQKLSFRYESLQDIKKLQKAFSSKKIITLTLNDGNREDVEKLMLKVRTTNFDGIKNVFIVIMSHGDKGDIIYAKTGSYSIRDDIVAPILKNPTLKEVNTFVISNACRGEIDPCIDSKNDVAIARKTLALDSTSLYPCDEKLKTIFSTQKGFVSLRFDEGAIFVQLFCDLFMKNFDEISMEKMGEELQKLMMENIVDSQIPDFGSSNGQIHSIKMEFVNSSNYDQLFYDLENFFKKHWNDDLKSILDGKNILREKQRLYLVTYSVALNNFNNDPLFSTYSGWNITSTYIYHSNWN